MLPVLLYVFRQLERLGSLRLGGSPIKVLTGYQSAAELLHLYIPARGPLSIDSLPLQNLLIVIVYRRIQSIISIGIFHLRNITQSEIPSNRNFYSRVFIMSPNGANGDATVGSDAPRQKGRATPDTIKYAGAFSYLIDFMVFTS